MRTSLLKIVSTLALVAAVVAFGYSSGRTEQMIQLPVPALPSHVPEANGKVTGQATPNVLSPELLETAVAQGSNLIENADANFPFYGYQGNGPMLPPPGAVQAPGM